MKTTNNPIAAARRVAVPLIALETSDPAAAILATVAALNGRLASVPVGEWDCINGLRNVAGNNAPGLPNADPNAPLDMVLKALADARPEKALVFIHNAHRFVNNDTVIQGLWNLRDAWKSVGATCILLCPGIKLPQELINDIVVIPEVLPSKEELSEVLARVGEDAQLKPIEAKTREKILSTVLGIPAFAAEQSLAMSCNLEERVIEMPSLRLNRRGYISQLPGVDVREDAITFADIAGYDVIKGYIRQKCNGKRPPGIIVWCDEIEKALAGASSDSSGVTQDQLGAILTWMQDKLNQDRLSAVLLVGFPGTGKSAISMATRNEAQCECIRLDMGGLKSKYVGDSEQSIRRVLKTVDAMSGGHILLLSTANSVAGLPSPFVSRHAMGTYMFDLPTKAEGEQLWKLKRAKYGITAKEANPPSIGWTGREIQQTCFTADDLGITLLEASKKIAPFVATGASEIEQLRKLASGRYLSASVEGLYQYNPPVTTGRKIG